MKLRVLTILVASALTAPFTSFITLAKDPVFSGPQPEERVTPFKAVHLIGSSAGQEIDLIQDNKGAATALVFIHGIERSMAPLMRVIDEYGALRKELLKTEFVFLSADRLEAERRIPAMANSLRLQSRLALSLDGIEGPGNYGLNKDCLMTIVLAKENKVAANFALVQPGIADAPQILEAMAKLAGDTQPPTVAQLEARRGGPSMARGESMPTPKDNFPGAVPTDERLLSYLRQFIRPSNDDQTVDQLLVEIEKYIGNNPDLRKQAIDGWTRIFHFGDRYGTAHSRKVGQALLERLKAKP